MIHARASALALVALLAVGCGCNFDPGTGDKVGQIVWMTREGLRDGCQTWEAQIIRGGMNGGSGSFGVTPFNFTVPESLVPQVHDAMRAQREVEIRYDRPFFYWSCDSASGGDVLRSIEVRR